MPKARSTLTKTKTIIRQKVKTDTGTIVALAALGIGAFLYFGKSGSKDNASAGSDKSIIEKITDRFTEGASDAGANVVTAAAGAPAQIVIGTAKKAVEKQQSEGDVVFSGIKNQGRTYSQFMQEKPMAVQAAVAAGDIITGGYATKFGKKGSDETKKAVAKIGLETPENMSKRFNALQWDQKVLVGLGQAITTPFYKGGAIAAGEQTRMNLKKAPIIGGWF